MVSPSVLRSTVKQQLLLFSPGSLFHIICTFAVYGVFSARCTLLVISKTGST